MNKFLLLLVYLPLLMGCLPEADNIPKTKEDIKIISGNLGKEKFFIPKAYFKKGMADFEDGTISLQMIQPEFIPLIKNTQQMWKDGEQVKYISILANEQRSFNNFSKNIKDQIDFLEVFETVGLEYDLIHLKQPKGYVQDKWDVWVETKDKENISYITCSEKIIPADIPQCTHAMRASGIYIQINYDKRNLPEWKKIQNGVLEAFDSFRSDDKAKEFLFQKYSNFKDNKGSK